VLSWSEDVPRELETSQPEHDAELEREFNVALHEVASAVR